MRPFARLRMVMKRVAMAHQANRALLWADRVRGHLSCSGAEVTPWYEPLNCHPNAGVDRPRTWRRSRRRMRTGLPMRSLGLPRCGVRGRTKR